MMSRVKRIEEASGTTSASFDVSSWGISRPNGNTLIQYAGSLSGQDFRHIAQCAPYVIHDLLSTAKLNAWVDLSRLPPLIWQTVMQNTEHHIVNFFLFLIC